MNELLSADISDADLALLQQYLEPHELAALDGLLIDQAAARKRYQTDPVAFVREVIGAEPADYQEVILRAIVQYRRVCVRSLHGAGKTGTASWVVLWFTTVFDECKVPTTASAWRQLTEFLWPEIHKWAIRANWNKIGRRVRLGRELLGQKLQVSPTAFAFALSSTDEAKIEGAHSEHLLYLFDEAKTIPFEIWDAAEGALGTDNTYAVAFSTPGDNSGRFYEIQMKKAGYEDWHVIHIGLEDVIRAGRVTRDWADQRKKAWGEQSALYQRRVLGNFAVDDAESLIQLSWIEAANARWQVRVTEESALVAKGHDPLTAERLAWGELLALGLDPARLGRDRTAFAYLYSSKAVKRLERTAKQELMPTVGKVVNETRDTAAIIKLDSIGLGAGIFDRLHELWKTREWRGTERAVPVIPINVGVPTKMTDKTGQLRFRRLRDWAWWHMRELLEDGEVDLPPDAELTEELVVVQWHEGSDGRIYVDDKDHIRERLPNGRSTDSADAVILANMPDAPTYRPLIAMV